jgi:hydrogenase large subunit
MAEKIIIHPLNRGSRPIKLELSVESGRVVSARTGTTYFWNNDKTLEGKEPMDAIQLTQRMCGIDFVSHSLAAVRALEEIAQIEMTVTGLRLRNILLALEMTYGHIAHFYQTALPDYVLFPNAGPFYNGIGDFRLPAATNERLIKNAWRAFDVRQLIHSIMAVIGGKAPHLCGIVFGGVTKNINSSEIIIILSILKDVTGFINNEYTNDLSLVQKAYPQYSSVGNGGGNFLAVGDFPESKRLDLRSSPKVMSNLGSIGMEKARISIDTTCSWFEEKEVVQPALSVELNPVPNKSGAYSWVKGAVYDKKTFETGAIARLVLSGSAATGGLGAVSAMGRHLARLEECKILVGWITAWLENTNLLEKPAVKAKVPAEGEAIGTAEASNGSVVHYISIKKGRIFRYNTLDSYSWNLCPFTREGMAGPLEQALLGLNVTGPVIPVEVIRVARSF